MKETQINQPLNDIKAIVESVNLRNDFSEQVGDSIEANNKYYFLLGAVHAQSVRMAEELGWTHTEAATVLIHEFVKSREQAKPQEELK